MKLEIKAAQRFQKKAKIALIGPSGSGKTLTALKLAEGFRGENGKILLLDTERGSASLYADQVQFDTADLPDYEYETFMAGIAQAKAAGYDVLIIDSASHAWEGFLEGHASECTRNKNSYTAWRKITPKYNKLINAIISYPGHCIITMRAKSEYVLQKDEQSGKETPKKIGLAAIMRPGVEYEFDVVGVIDIDHNLMIEKTRFDFLDQKVLNKADEEFGRKILAWLSAGAVAAPKAPTKAQGGDDSEQSEADEAVARTRAALKVGKAYKYSRSAVGKILKAGGPEDVSWLWDAAVSQFGAAKSGEFIYTHTAVEEWADALLLPAVEPKKEK